MRLATHPDPLFFAYILEGLQYGFHIGFDKSMKLCSATGNLPSVAECLEVIDNDIFEEVQGQCMIGPLPSVTLSNGSKVHLNWIGLLPKGLNSGKWRLITDMSFPTGESVNNGIDPRLCSLEYTSVDKVAKAVSLMGRGTLLAKVDIRSAYRLIPVHPSD